MTNSGELSGSLEPTRPSIGTGKIAREVVSNILLGLIFFFFAKTFFEAYMLTGAASLLFFLLKACLDMFFVLIRRVPLSVSISPFAWAVAILGTWVPLFLRPAEPLLPGLYPVGFGIQLTGLAFQIIAIVFLNRSFGIVAANRGIKQNGAYRYVRHPLYATYLIGEAGFVLANFSLANCVFVSCHLVLVILRIREEEKHLALDTQYQSYMHITPWRLIPGLY